MPFSPLYAACIRRAAFLLGGYGPLGARMGVEPLTLEAWATGQADVPELVFLLIVDILLEYQIAPIPTRSLPEASTKYRR